MKNEVMHVALKHEPVELAIIGGGAAGAFAAGVAAERGVKALVFERKARLGAKMLMTANGRCNFTKDIAPERLLAECGDDVAAFARKAVSELPPAKIVAGFNSLGVRTKRMTDGRIFPASEKAADVVHALGDQLRAREVPILVNCPVTSVQPLKNGFLVGTKNFTIWATNVLVATGGLSFPKTGSVGDGQIFARALGHRIVSPRAGLTGFDMARPEKGVFPDSVARVVVGGEARCEYRGEIEFDATGVVGSAVYNCQRWAAKFLDVRDWTLELEFDARHLELASPVPRPVKESIVTLGGVALDEVNPETMESLKVPGLYFAGEVLDVDGPTGGYNLTLAFATARLAVAAIAAKTPHAPPPPLRRPEKRAPGRDSVGGHARPGAVMAKNKRFAPGKGRGFGRDDDRRRGDGDRRRDANDRRRDGSSRDDRWFKRY